MCTNNNFKSNDDFKKVALRQNAFYVPNFNDAFSPPNAQTLSFIKSLAEYGFGVSESLLHALNDTSDEDKQSFITLLSEILGTTLNWTPLVKDWQTPTNETPSGYWQTFLFNIKALFSDDKDNKDNATLLQCGHYIPNDLFELSRYNGCPYCGTPFEFESLTLKHQGSGLKLLNLWTDKDIHAYLQELLTSPVPLDATQTDSLKLLLKHITPSDETDIAIKETLVLVVDYYMDTHQPNLAGRYFKTPTDVLRYLWYKQTGFLQLIEPKTLIKQSTKNNRHYWQILDNRQIASQTKKDELKLKYSRKTCKIVAKWLNELPLSPKQSAQMMHPKRQMWVRFIRALRLHEYAKKDGFDNLKTLLDIFYRGDYPVWAGQVENHRLKNDITALALLKERPSVFARSLFANILRFGSKDTLAYFEPVAKSIPMRLLLTLNAYADSYFDKTAKRSVKTIIGTRKLIDVNPLVKQLSDDELKAIKADIKNLCLSELTKRFKNQVVEFGHCYIDPELMSIPLPIGDRMDNVQDFLPTLMGERFDLQGDTIRLFMQWGQGLPAQHLDMDLSCQIIYDDKTDYCAYFEKYPVGCRHSGDIREIPDMIGTAEYIEIDFETLNQHGAKFVSFTCHAYSVGDISPNLVVGFMDSKYPMTVSEKGVAYDPSCVIKQVKISRPLQKGLLFGVLDVKARQVIWLEMAFDGQTAMSLDGQAMTALLAKLANKITIGQLLHIKAKAHGWQIETDPSVADIVYDVAWARDLGNINQLLN